MHGRKELEFHGFSSFSPAVGAQCLRCSHKRAVVVRIKGIPLCGGGEWSPVFRIMIRFCRRANKESRFCGVCG